MRPHRVGARIPKEKHGDTRSGSPPASAAAMAITYCHQRAGQEETSRTRAACSARGRPGGRRVRGWVVSSRLGMVDAAREATSGGPPSFNPTRHGAPIPALYASIAARQLQQLGTDNYIPMRRGPNKVIGEASDRLGPEVMATSLNFPCDLDSSLSEDGVTSN